MRFLALSAILFFISGTTRMNACTIAVAQADPFAATTIELTGQNNEAADLVKLAPQLVNLSTVVLDRIADAHTAEELVASIAACNSVRTVIFRNCTLTQLPGNLRMLTQVTSFRSEDSEVDDGMQFYNAIADMQACRNVYVSGTNFHTLPCSFFRLRTMDNIDLVNEDLNLARGYDRNTKTPAQLRVTDSVQFGFGSDALNLRYTCYNAEAGKAHLCMFRDVLQGAFRSSNEFYSPVKQEAFIKQHPLVNPAVSGIEIAPDVYTVNTLTGTVLEYGSGTRIIVPPMAFVDACGNPVAGNVDITYREFRDQLDVVLSGIPMDYDSGGVEGKFESAGMFDIEASQNGEEVFLAEDKQIDMKFAVTDTASDINFYRLDESSGWQYLENTGHVELDSSGGNEFISGDPATTRNPDASGNPPYVTFAVSEYCNAAKHIYVRNWIRDTTEFDDRYYDTTYFGTEKIVTASFALTQTQKAAYSSRIFLERRAGGPDYTLVSVKNIPGVCGWNTELAAYGGYMWRLDGKLNDNDVNIRFGRGAGINDCRVLQEGGDYFLELKYYWGFEKIKAEPVRLKSNGEITAPDEDKKDKLFASYTKKLNARRTRLNNWNGQQIGRQQQRYQRAHNDSVNAWKGLEKVMSAEEKAMDFPAWRKYTDSLTPFVKYHGWMADQQDMSVFQLRMDPLKSRARMFYQQLPVVRTGIHNCDRVVLRNPKVPLRVFVSKTILVAGSVIVPTVIHVVDKLKNRVFSYSGGTVGNGVRAAYEADQSIFLLATDEAGNLYKISQEDFVRAEQLNASDPEFNATLVSGPGSTPATVREIIDRGNQ